ncbi:ESX secretion-associated protein EspG [Mycolicibacterium moriokaense]|uniref:ESX-3 secretion-associated protein EspG3 n=1 Tax=Mycolicibacterium moriokaense TaxID=39691 RepID=A0AAD1H6F5_9MYCO|nr:ESX secretion-associated protein EspG [Mycolicibacterium moriokaense]MCV7042419.1 ESX secretion-associated protein EspG [Mycolicibacterium moriokaense]ORB22979.1 ESX secretion-associated protein EspG [Mycolicibacterium moriokaense]BBW99089.1 ESX-3 secretion-associated protein EspG3 [Mycolicibacterium moriokaense]
MAANAVELTAEQAWFVADALGAGNFPWVLAITPPFSDHAERAEFTARLFGELTGLGVMTADGVIDPGVRQWITATCRARRWLELRFVRGSGTMLRGYVARAENRGDELTVALRSGGLVTFTALDIGDPQALVPILTAGLSGRSPAQFEEFTIPAQAGARADERLRDGAALDDVIEFLGIPATARAVVAAAYSSDRSYVEIVAGDHRDGHRVSTDVGVSVVDTREGRVLVSPWKAFDGEWVSTFTAGTPLAIATAIERLTATLPDGPWFPDQKLTRDFNSDQRTEHLKWRQTVS